MIDRILDKLLSGRFIFTIIVALVYAKMCLTDPAFAKETKEVIFVVLYAYFTRSDRKTNENGGGQ